LALETSNQRRGELRRATKEDAGPFGKEVRHLVSSGAYGLNSVSKAQICPERLQHLHGRTINSGKSDCAFDSESSVSLEIPNRQQHLATSIPSILVAAQSRSCGIPGNIPSLHQGWKSTRRMMPLKTVSNHKYWASNIPYGYPRSDQTWRSHSLAPNVSIPRKC
jgi:hypothetical protein